MQRIVRYLKLFLQSVAGRFGYRIERIADLGHAQIDVFDILISQLAASRPDFFFIQIGANDGVSDDPLRHYVVRHHWRGLLVEPQPRAFAELTKNYSGETQLLFENAAISDSDGEVELFSASAEADPAMRLIVSMDRALVQRWVGYSVPLVIERVKAVSVETLLARHGVEHVDLLQIDAEGFDFEIIKMFDAVGKLPVLVQFEHLMLSNVEREACFRFLSERGYRLSRADINTVAYRQPSGVR
jgi:FkbM family methyltransferase